MARHRRPPSAILNYENRRSAVLGKNEKGNGRDRRNFSIPKWVEKKRKINSLVVKLYVLRLLSSNGMNISRRSNSKIPVSWKGVFILARVLPFHRDRVLGKREFHGVAACVRLTARSAVARDPYRRGNIVRLPLLPPLLCNAETRSLRVYSREYALHRVAEEAILRALCYYVLPLPLFFSTVFEKETIEKLTLAPSREWNNR